MLSIDVIFSSISQSHSILFFPFSLSYLSFPTVSTLQSVVCSNDSLFYFIFFYPFPIFGILLIAVLLVRYKSRSHSKSQEGKNGAPLLWIKEPHLSYSPPAWTHPSSACTPAQWTKGQIHSPHPIVLIADPTNTTPGRGYSGPPPV